MFSKMLTLAVAAIATLALAGTAQAAVIDTDSVRLTGTGYDFGGSTFVAGAPTGSGELEFRHTSGKIAPRLTGKLHINDADGTCARMRLRYFDAAGNQLGASKYGGTVCVDDDQHHSYTVDLDPYSENSIDSVQVAVQKETASGWSTVDYASFGVDTHSDNVKITEDGVDVGGRDFAFGEPIGSARMTWGLQNGIVEPRLEGYLHLNNSSGVCARVNLRYLTAGGTFLTAEPGGQVCADDNGHHRWSIDLSPYDSSKIGKVKVQLQTQGSNGSWNVAGSDTVSIAE